MEAALLRELSPGPGSLAPSEADRPRPERRALARGVLDALRILSSTAPLMVAVDDAQWLDRPSAGVLEFCFRRLQREQVAILVTFRAGEPVPLSLDRALPPDRLSHLRLGPLSLGGIGEILRSRLGAVPPRYILTRLYDACGGNPFYALECERFLLERLRMPRTNEPIPIPQSLSDLVRHRLRGLAPDVRRVGRLVAASADPRERVIRAAAGEQDSWAAIDRAIDVGVLERDGDVVRFTHPLLRSVLYAEMTPKQRTATHRRLAATADDIEERAWHLALCAERPDAETATMLDAAATHAALRGAPEEAAALAEQATKLTHANRPDEIHERTVRAADYHFRSGDMARSRELIESVLAATPAGPPSAPLLLRLATIHYHQSGWPLAEATFRQAAEAAPDEPALRAHAEQERAIARLVAGDLPAACRWASVSLRSAEEASDPRLLAHSLARIAAFEFFRGNGVRHDLLDRAEALEASIDEDLAGRSPFFGPAFTRGLLLKWCDRLDEARLKLAGAYRHALDRGDEASLPFMLYHLSELECWAGNWDAADEYAVESCRVADESHQQTMTPAALYSLALVRSHRGRVQDAQDLAGKALALCEKTGNVPVASQLVSILGFVALSLDDHQAAHSHLGRLASTLAALGLGEPSVVKFLPDEIEALAALGEFDRAQSFTRQLDMGELIGWSWLFPPFTWAFGAVAASPVEAFEFDARKVRAQCVSDPALGYEVTWRVAEVLTKRLKSTRTRLITASIRPAGTC
jgi:tetratricopeptide (TPR) repeat protein